MNKYWLLVALSAFASGVCAQVDSPEEQAILPGGCVVNDPVDGQLNLEVILHDLHELVANSYDGVENDLDQKIAAMIRKRPEAFQPFSMPALIQTEEGDQTSGQEMMTLSVLDTMLIETRAMIMLLSHVSEREMAHNQKFSAIYQLSLRYRLLTHLLRKNGVEPVVSDEEIALCAQAKAQEWVAILSADAS